MADPRVVNFEGKTQIFPADATDAEISAALNAIPAANAKDVPKAKTWAPSDSGAVAMSGAAHVVPVAGRIAEEAATNPGVPRGMAAVGRAVGAVEGAMKSGPLAIGPGAWAGGKAGWFTGKVLQGAAAPAARALDAVKPYVQALSTASGAQGALDLAQMAEPNRKDIGVFGVGMGDPGDTEHPALLNLIATKIGDAVKSLVAKGMSEKEAVMTVLNVKAKAK